jgi:predicted flap endonuclease-1-like 5' DNA nuclease
VDKYLEKDAVQQAIDLYLDTLSNVPRQQLKPEYLESLTNRTRNLAEQLETLLSQIQALAAGSREDRILLYSLLRQLPTITFEPLNYAFVGRVVIPLENVLDLLINLDMYTGGEPVRKGKEPGVVELLSLSEATEPTDTSSERSVIDISGIGPSYSAILHKQGDIRTTQDLLEQADTEEKRANLSEKTGLSEKFLLTWFQRADLMRIESVGEEYGELLTESGVHSVAELTHSKAQSLYERMQSVNAARRLVQRLPSIDQVQKWIEQAQKLAAQ